MQKALANIDLNDSDDQNFVIVIVCFLYNLQIPDEVFNSTKDTNYYFIRAMFTDINFKGVQKLCRDSITDEMIQTVFSRFSINPLVIQTIQPDRQTEITTSLQSKEQNETTPISNFFKIERAGEELSSGTKAAFRYILVCSEKSENDFKGLLTHIENILNSPYDTLSVEDIVGYDNYHPITKILQKLQSSKDIPLISHEYGTNYKFSPLLRNFLLEYKDQLIQLYNLVDSQTSRQ
jgi:hypothetical protein